MLFALLQAAGELTAVVADNAADSTWKVYLSAGATVFTGLLSAAKFIQWATEKARQKGYAKLFADPSTASPKQPEAPNPVLVEMRALADESRRQSHEMLAMARVWRQQDVEATAERRLAKLLPELEAKQTALVEARAINAELLRVAHALRTQVAQLQFERDEGVVIDVVALDDWSEKTPTLPPKRLR